MNKTEEIEKTDLALQNVLAALDAADKDLVITAHERDDNLRDVVMHLVRWQELLINVLENPSADLLPDGYSWDTYKDLNQVFHDESQSISYEDAVSQLEANNDKIVALYVLLSDADAEKLADNFSMLTYRHYPWAIDMIEQSK